MQRNPDPSAPEVKVYSCGWLVKTDLQTYNAATDIQSSTDAAYCKIAVKKQNTVDSSGI